MQLLLLAVDPDREGRPRFNPSLAPALVLADLLDKTQCREVKAVEVCVKLGVRACDLA